MLSGMERYDPRLCKWIPREPMNHPRGFFSAAMLKDSIYVIGGADSLSNMVDLVECYKEGEGWISTNLKAVDAGNLYGTSTCGSAFLRRGFDASVNLGEPDPQIPQGSVPMAFGGTEEPAAYGELVSIGGLNPDVNKKLSAAIANILETATS
ncbi:hypothetical protein Leryth_003524 [Lithospermum erythrorhizon]|nr:hypothetical protein Leryth_003524 [Lithospermum erythrorhizon]